MATDRLALLAWGAKADTVVARAATIFMVLE
jgi:hypothetical protein